MYRWTPILVLALAGCTAESLDDHGEVALVRGAPLSVETTLLEEVLSYVYGLDPSHEEDLVLAEQAFAALPTVEVSVDHPEVLSFGRDPNCDDTVDYCQRVQVMGFEEGTTTLHWDDPISGAGSLLVSVHEPDRVEVSTRDIADPDGADSEVGHPRVLAGAPVRFTVRAWSGDLALQGTDMVHVSHGIGLESETGSSHVDLMSEEAGHHEVEVGVAGLVQVVLPIEVLTVDDAHQLVTGEERTYHTDEGRVVRRPTWVEDADGHPILGARPEWTVDGAGRVSGEGIRYTYDPDGAIDVVATFGDLTLSDTLPASEAAPYTNGGGAIDPLTGSVALALGVLGWRRRSGRP